MPDDPSEEAFFNPYEMETIESTDSDEVADSEEVTSTSQKAGPTPPGGNPIVFPPRPRPFKLLATLNLNHNSCKSIKVWRQGKNAARFCCFRQKGGKGAFFYTHMVHGPSRKLSTPRHVRSIANAIRDTAISRGVRVKAGKITVVGKKRKSYVEASQTLYEGDSSVLDGGEADPESVIEDTLVSEENHFVQKCNNVQKWALAGGGCAVGIAEGVALAFFGSFTGVAIPAGGGVAASVCAASLAGAATTNCNSPAPPAAQILQKCDHATLAARADAKNAAKAALIRHNTVAGKLGNQSCDDLRETIRLAEDEIDARERQDKDCYCNGNAGHNKQTNERKTFVKRARALFQQKKC